MPTETHTPHSESAGSEVSPPSESSFGSPRASQEKSNNIRWFMVLALSLLITTLGYGAYRFFLLQEFKIRDLKRHLEHFIQQKVLELPIPEIPKPEIPKPEVIKPIIKQDVINPALPAGISPSAPHATPSVPLDKALEKVQNMAQLGPLFFYNAPIHTPKPLLALLEKFQGTIDEATPRFNAIQVVLAPYLQTVRQLIQQNPHTVLTKLQSELKTLPLAVLQVEQVTEGSGAEKVRAKWLNYVKDHLQKFIKVRHRDQSQPLLVQDKTQQIEILIEQTKLAWQTQQGNLFIQRLRQLSSLIQEQYQLDHAAVQETLHTLTALESVPNISEVAAPLWQALAPFLLDRI